MHACKHVFIPTHTYIHTHIHTYIHTNIWKWIYVYIFMYINICTYTYVTYVCRYVYTPSWPHTNTHTHSRLEHSRATPHAGKRVIFHRRDAPLPQHQPPALHGAWAGALERGAVVVPAERAAPIRQAPGSRRGRGRRRGCGDGRAHRGHSRTTRCTNTIRCTISSRIVRLYTTPNIEALVSLWVRWTIEAFTRDMAKKAFIAGIAGRASTRKALWTRAMLAPSPLSARLAGARILVVSGVHVRVGCGRGGGVSLCECARR